MNNQQKSDVAHQSTSLSQKTQSNANMVSVANRGQRKNINLITTINFVKKNYEKEVKIQRTIENATFFQFSTAGNIIDVSNKHFTKYVHHLQSKNLNFVPTIKIFNRKLHYINRKL